MRQGPPSDDGSTPPSNPPRRPPAPPLLGRAFAVVGASGGIGAACAQRIVRMGGAVMLTGRAQARLRSRRAELIAMGAPAEHIEHLSLDLRMDTACPALVERTVDRFGRLDGVINAAGIGELGAFVKSDLERSLEQVETNLMGAARLAHAAIPALQAHQGKFIQLVSGLAFSPSPEGAVFAATQHGLVGLIRSLRLEHVGKGVGFALVSVAGAGVNTRFWARAAPHTPRGQMMDPQRVAEAVLAVLMTPPDALVDELRLRTS